MENRYLFRGKRIDNGEWTEGFLFMRRYAHNAEPFEAYIIQDAYEQLGVGVGKWNYGEHSVLISPLTIKEIDDGFGHYRVDLKTICQCTAMPDKNGKIAYEHDIIKTPVGNAKIIWNCSPSPIDNHINVGFEVVFLDAIANDNYRHDLGYWIGKSEFIGSVFDNLELLEVGE